MTAEVEMIHVNIIDVINPRTRNANMFQEIVDSIGKIGLKKPITVRRKPKRVGHLQYDLVCGQGRLEAFVQLKQDTIPAIILDTDEESCLVMSLVENIARRRIDHDTLIREVKRLKHEGESISQIAKKLGYDVTFISQINRLIKEHSEDLIIAVESKRIPLSVALDLSTLSDENGLSALQKAYETGELRGKKFLAAKKLIEKRASKSKRGPRHKRALTKDGLVRAYEQEANKQRKMINKSDRVQNTLLMTYSGLKKLLDEEHFVTLLQAEKLDTMPKYLHERLASRE
jgi:ParB family transcriptional regulator, chromosome partitioning protein